MNPTAFKSDGFSQKGGLFFQKYAFFFEKEVVFQSAEGGFF